LVNKDLFSQGQVLKRETVRNYVIKPCFFMKLLFEMENLVEKLLLLTVSTCQ